MDISFDVKNSEGDHIMVALSYYDYEAISLFSSDPLTLTLVFYDVTLVRKAGYGFVGYRELFAISDTLAKFMDDNRDAVLCFYCDSANDVRRNHPRLLPQEYRSRLFSRMFDIYIASHKRYDLVNHIVEIEDPDNPANRQIAHFICRSEHKAAVLSLGQLLMNK